MSSDNDNFAEWRYKFELGALVVRAKHDPLDNASALYYASLFALLPVMDSLHSNKNENLDSLSGLFGTILRTRQ